MEKNGEIDLLYLTNQNFIDKYNKQKEKESDSEYLEDLLFYRKRILNITKQLLRKNSITKNVDDSFKNYSIQLIKHLKFKDKKDLLQEEFKEFKQKTKKSVKKDFNLSDQNQIMTREIKKQTKTIENCIPLIKHKKNLPKDNFFAISEQT